MLMLTSAILVHLTMISSIASSTAAQDIVVEGEGNPVSVQHNASVHHVLLLPYVQHCHRDQGGKEVDQGGDHHHVETA